MRVCGFLLFTLLTSAQTRFEPAQVERGRAQFKSNCGFCHGDDATGSRGPDLIRSPVLSHDTNGDLLAPLIRNGRTEKGMPGFPSLKAAQVADIGVFLHYLADVALKSSHVPPDYPLAKLLTGNKQSGKKFFEGAGGCSGCHSVAGDLKGIASKYGPLELQQRFLYPSKSTMKPRATVTLPNGETFEGAVAHNDEFEIAMTGADGWYRSWPREKVTVVIRDPLAAHRELMPRYTDADIHDLFAYLEAQK